MRCHSQTEFYKNITELVIAYKSPYYSYFITKRTKGENKLDLGTNRVQKLEIKI